MDPIFDPEKRWNASARPVPTQTEREKIAVAMFGVGERNNHATAVGAIEQPKPKGAGKQVAPEVIKDIEARIAKGIETYGEPLTTHNGRSAKLDKYQELLDAAIYAKQELMEEADKNMMWLPAQFDWKPIVVLKNTESVLQEAHRLVNGDRGEAYGHPLDDFGRTAGMLTHLLSDKLKPGVSLNARDVAMMMVCVKLSRERNKPKRDNRVDGAGYLGTLDMVMDEATKRGIDLLKQGPEDAEPTTPLAD